MLPGYLILERLFHFYSEYNCSKCGYLLDKVECQTFDLLLDVEIILMSLQLLVSPQRYYPRVMEIFHTTFVVKSMNLSLEIDLYLFF